MIDLTIPEHAYMFGLFQTDGNLNKIKGSKNKGRLALEISKRDEDILYKLQKIIPVNSFIRHRTRNTNFKKNYESCSLTIHDLIFRTEINYLGVPYGKKSDIIEPPVDKVSKIDYIRGLYDGDGSVGISEKDIPIVSFTTRSTPIAEYIRQFIFEIIGKKLILNRNKRDNIYNLALTNEDAQVFCKVIYYENCLCIERKMKSSLEIRNWNRPTNVKKKTFNKRWWTQEEDKIVLENDTTTACKLLNRTSKSVNIRKWRLTNSKTGRYVMTYV